MKKLIFFWSIFVISFQSIIFSRGVYNIYRENYTYDCRWKDNTSDWCKYGEMVLEIHQWSASKSGSYRCWKIDKVKPGISNFASTIKPTYQWVNILEYNPLKDFKVTVRDWQSWLKKIIITIGNKTAKWYFSSPKSSKTITYNDLCQKILWTTNDCRKKLLQEWKNIIKVEAWDAVKSPYDGSECESCRNYNVKSTYVYVDNSRASYDIFWDKAYNAIVDSKINPSKYFLDNKWKNRTLNLIFKVKDKLGENGWLKPIIKVCSWKPENSIWYLPIGVDPNSGKFTTYCDSAWNCNPDVSDCKWKCKEWYIYDDWKCVLEKKQLSCKKYFENKRWYNLSKVDGIHLYYWLKWYWTDAINKKTGTFTAVYDPETNSYKPTLNDCLLIPWDVNYTITEVDSAWNEVKVTQKAAWIIELAGSLVKVVSSIMEKTCAKLSQLTDFGGAGDVVKAWWGDKVVPVYWIDDSSDGNSNVNKEDDNKNHLVDDEWEGSWRYLNPKTNTYTKDITEACGKVECVPNASWLDSSNCQCNKGYYPIEKNNKNRYNECIKLSTNQCMVDSDGDGFYDTVKYLASNQIVKMIYTPYNKAKKIPECWKICWSLEVAKDTDGDWWPDTCKTKCCTFDETNLDECILCGE